MPHMTSQEDEAIRSLRDKGYAIVIWTPEEIGSADIAHLEELMIERGAIFIGESNRRRETE